MGVNVIARQLNLSPSSCFNILKTLAAEEFVVFDEKTKAYTIGGGLIEISRRALDPHRVFDLIRSRLEQFSEKTHMTVGLWTLFGNSHLILVNYAANSTNTRIHLSVGQRLPKLIGAIGRCIAASGELSHQEIEGLFGSLRWESPLTFETYLNQVDEAGRRGWGMDEGTFIRGVTTMGSPICGSECSPRYFLSTAMFKGQYSKERIDDIATEMLEICQWAAKLLGT